MPTMRILPASEKCFADESIESKELLSSISMLRNEPLSFQLATILHDPRTTSRTASLRIDSPLSPYLRIWRIEQVPVKLATYADNTDHDYLRKAPGLYPDLMIPYEERPKLLFCSRELRSYYVTVHCAEGLKAGIYPITMQAMDGEELLCSATLEVEVIDAMLPERDLIYTCWFHSDCLASYYRCEVFSEEYWRIVGNFIEAAVEDGQNMLLTPVFTPPLDTAVGHERLTVQLVDVTVEQDGSYTFGFDRFDHWVDLALSKGIRYIEISHLYTQWGCAHAPKIIAATPEGERRIWGWDTDAHGLPYQTFLRAFLKAFLSHASELGISDRLYFHISDEPSVTHLDAYRHAKQAIADLLEGYPIIDALSDFTFYETGVIDRPIPATNHITPFLEAGVKDLWTYYCCGQHTDVSNRHLAMPGYRTRILGAQLFKFRLVGFLQWGFNFYNCQGSLYPINPYEETSGDYFVPAGDCFVVYPAADGGAYPTLHGRQFAQGLVDYAALVLCAERIGFEATVRLMEQDAGEAITFSRYPRSHKYLLSMRERINRAIQKSLGT